MSSAKMLLISCIVVCDQFVTHCESFQERQVVQPWVWVTGLLEHDDVARLNGEAAREGGLK
jgi:hypothetical protein